MANTRPTHVGFSGAVHLCFLLLFRPEAFRLRQEEDNKLLNAHDGEQTEKDHSALVVRRAFFLSFCLVFASGAVGYAVGYLLTHFMCCASTTTIAWLQTIGASILLWGTLFIRGFEIQTHGGITLTERVNQWIYRTLYCIGTGILVWSVAWTQCPPTLNNVVERDAPKTAHSSP